MGNNKLNKSIWTLFNSR